jgi:hypothetical protein
MTFPGPLAPDACPLGLNRSWLHLLPYPVICRVLDRDGRAEHEPGQVLDGVVAGWRWLSGSEFPPLMPLVEANAIQRRSSLDKED